MQVVGQIKKKYIYETYVLNMFALINFDKHNNYTSLNVDINKKQSIKTD